MLAKATKVSHETCFPNQGNLRRNFKNNPSFQKKPSQYTSYYIKSQLFCQAQTIFLLTALGRARARRWNLHLQHCLATAVLIFSLGDTKSDTIIACGSWLGQHAQYFPFRLFVNIFVCFPLCFMIFCLGRCRATPSIVVVTKPPSCKRENEAGCRRTHDAFWVCIYIYTYMYAYVCTNGPSRLEDLSLSKLVNAALAVWRYVWRYVWRFDLRERTTSSGSDLHEYMSANRAASRGSFAAVTPCLSNSRMFKLSRRSTFEFCRTYTLL